MYPAATRRVLQSVCRILSFCCLSSLFLCALLYPSRSTAGSFSVNPVRIELSALEPNAVIHVENTGSKSVTVQLTTMAWSQVDGRDQLRPTRELLSTPQIFTLKAAAMQVVRVGSLRKPDPRQVLAYRLLLEEIPAPASPDFKGFQVALKISMPVFLKPAQEVREQLEIAMNLQSDKQLTLALSNTGDGVAHWSGFTLHDDAFPDRVLASYPGAVYVLPGQRRQLSLFVPDIGTGTKVMIRAATRGSLVEFHGLPVSP